MAGINLSETSEYLNALIGVGNDAMTNLYYLKFTGKPATSSNIVQSLIVRAGDFQPPKPEQGNHSVNFLTVDALFPSPEIKIDKQFDITFRVDEGYKVYEYLLALQSATSVASIGRAYTVTNPSGNSTDILGLEVYVPGNAAEMKANEIASGIGGGIPSGWDKAYEFKYLWIKKITPPRFSYENPQAATIGATFGFFTYKDNLRKSDLINNEAE